MRARLILGALVTAGAVVFFASVLLTSAPGTAQLIRSILKALTSLRSEPRLTRKGILVRVKGVVSRSIKELGPPTGTTFRTSQKSGLASVLNPNRSRVRAA